MAHTGSGPLISGLQVMLLMFGGLIVVSAAVGALFIFTDIGDPVNAGFDVSTTSDEYRIQLIDSGNIEVAQVSHPQAGDLVLDDTGDLLHIPRAAGNLTIRGYTDSSSDVLSRTTANESPGVDHVVSASGGGDYQRIQPAINAAGEGDVILVKSGQYIEDVIVNSSHVSVIAEDGANIIDPSDGDGHGITVTATHTRLYNLHVAGSDHGVYVSNSATKTKLYSLTVEGGQTGVTVNATNVVVQGAAVSGQLKSAGIVVQPAARKVAIEWTAIRNGGGAGITVLSPHSTEVTRNYITENDGPGIVVAGNQTTVTANTIEANGMGLVLGESATVEENLIRLNTGVDQAACDTYDLSSCPESLGVYVREAAAEDVTFRRNKVASQTVRLYNAGQTEVDARWNWWGQASVSTEVFRGPVRYSPSLNRTPSAGTVYQVFEDR